MRDILFRGMTENKVWKHGYYWKRSDVDHLHYIIDEGYNNVMVLPETVGQYTGLCDMNGTKMFEILSRQDTLEKMMGMVTTLMITILSL